MKPYIPYLLLFGPMVALTVAYMGTVVMWHRRLNSGTVDETTKKSAMRRLKLLARIIKNLGWAYLLVFLVLGLLGRIFRHE